MSDPIRALAQALNAEKRVADQLAEAVAFHMLGAEEPADLRAALDAYYAHRGGPS